MHLEWPLLLLNGPYSGYHSLPQGLDKLARNVQVDEVELGAPRCELLKDVFQHHLHVLEDRELQGGKGRGGAGRGGAGQGGAQARLVVRVALVRQEACCAEKNAMPAKECCHAHVSVILEILRADEPVCHKIGAGVRWLLRLVWLLARPLHSAAVLCVSIDAPVQPGLIHEFGAIKRQQAGVPEG